MKLEPYLRLLKDENGEPLMMSQDEAILKYNELGLVMAALPDFYQAFKHRGVRFRHSFQETYFVKRSWDRINTSTRIIRTGPIKSHHNGKVIHYFGSEVMSPLEKEITIPDFKNDYYLDRLLSDGEELEDIQALLGTKDDGRTILDVFKEYRNLPGFFSGAKAADLTLCMPDKQSRKKQSNWSVSLGYLGVSNICWFSIDLDPSTQEEVSYSVKK